MKRTTSLLALVLALSACAGEKDEPIDTDTDATETDDTQDTEETDTEQPGSDCEVTPGDWSAPDWETNAAEALALRAALDTLVNTARASEQDPEANPISVDDLVELYESGEPSIASITTDGFDAVVRGAFEEFADVVAAGKKSLFNEAFEFTPGEHGGIDGTSFRGINEGGIEVRQILDKGLFGGGAFYPWALGLTTGEITPATIDALAAIFGADETLTGETVTDSANYAKQMSLFAPAAEALTAAKAYAASEACTAERDAALVDFFRTWERALVARTVFYTNVTASRLAAPANKNDVIEALHAFGEGLGLTGGLYGVSDPTSGPLAGAGRVISDAKVLEAIETLGVSLTNLGASAAGDFVLDPDAFAEAVTAFENLVKEVYGVDDATIASWRPQR